MVNKGNTNPWTSIYLSLPITGHEKEAPIKAAKAKEELMRRYSGIRITTPFEICGEEDDYNTCMGKCIHELLDSDAVYFMRGFWKSSGCRLEYEAARLYNKTVIIE